VFFSIITQKSMEFQWLLHYYIIHYTNVSIVDKCFLILVDEVVAKNDKKKNNQSPWLSDEKIFSSSFKHPLFLPRPTLPTTPTILFYT